MLWPQHEAIGQRQLVWEGLLAGSRAVSRYRDRPFKRTLIELAIGLLATRL